VKQVGFVSVVVSMAISVWCVYFVIVVAQRVNVWPF
jgi:hypothetical protein